MVKNDMNYMKKNVFFVSGIDTGVGKSYATGYLAKVWNEKGIRTITQKLVQTGNTDVSEDIELHRKIMGCGFLPEDDEKLTMPEIFSYPCSPHLAAEIDGREIDFGKIESAAVALSERYDAVLLEGAGGLMVPLTRSLLTLDYAAEKGWPLILVTSGKLGSINHTLMSLELCRLRGIRVSHVVYNDFPADSEWIKNDSITIIRAYLERHFPECRLLELPVIRNNAWETATLDIL